MSGLPVRFADRLGAVPAALGAKPSELLNGIREQVVISPGSRVTIVRPWYDRGQTLVSRAGNNALLERPSCLTLDWLPVAMSTPDVSGIAGYALAKAVLDRLVAKGFLTDGAARRS